jgi:hypothetical protein
MSRPLFDVTIRVRMQNGQSGIVELEADKLVTAREVQAVFDKAMRMVDRLREEPAVEEYPADAWRPPLRAV